MSKRKREYEACEQHKRLLRHNADQIRKWCVNRDCLQPGSRGEVQVRAEERKRRGASSPPIPDAGLRYVEDNRVVASYIVPALERLKLKSFPEWLACSKVMGESLALDREEADPGLLRRWEDGETEDDRQWFYTFRRGCRIASGYIYEMDPEVELHIEIRREEEMVPSGSTPRHVYNQDRAIDRAESLRRIYQRWERVKTDRGVGSEEAKQIMHDEPPYIHPKRTEEAITFCRRAPSAS